MTGVVRTSLTTIDPPAADDGMNNEILKFVLTGRSRVPIEGMGYNAGTYTNAWVNLNRYSAQPAMVVNAQFKRFHSYPFNIPHDTAEVISCSQFISSCVIVLSQYGYEIDSTSESVLNTVVRKMPIELKAKWMIYLHRFNPSYKTKRVFSAGLRNIAEFQKKLENAATDKGNFVPKAE